MSKVYIVSAKRTAVGAFMGSVSGVTAAKLGGTVIRNTAINTIAIFFMVFDPFNV